MLGQRLEPEGYDPLADNADLDRMRAGFEATRKTLVRVAAAAPRHEDVLARMTGIPVRESA